MIRHPWGYEAGFEPHYQSHSQYYLERDRKPPVYYGYPDTQFPQVRRGRERDASKGAAGEEQQLNWYSCLLSPRQPYWNYRDQPSYLTTEERHSTRPSVEGTGATGQTTYDSSSYSTASGLRSYPSDAYSTAGE